MPHTVSPPSLLSRWRLPVLGVAIVAIVVGPFLIMRAAMGEADAATEKVMHTREVESLMQTVAADARSLEAAAMTRAPMILPISTAVRPTPPAAPCTSSVSPGFSRARCASATWLVP